MSLKLSASRPRQLQYSGAGLRRDLRLLEVDEALLSDIGTGGVVIKGGQGDDAVLCTADKTFALKYVETTNTLLLLPPDEAGDQEFGAVGSLTQPDAARIPDTGLQTQLHKAATAGSNPPLVATATAVAHIEVVRIMPHLVQLRELLAAARPYGLEDEAAAAASDGGGGGSGGSNAGFTTQQLLELVQASRAELLAELSSLNALCLGGRWRLVDEEYLGRLLEVLLLSATEEGWSLDAIPLEAACSALEPDGYRPALVRHCLQVHGRQTNAAAAMAGEGSGSGAGEPAEGGEAAVYALDRSSVCLHFARKLLATRPSQLADAAAGPPPAASSGGAGGAPRPWRRSEFLAAWAAAVPEEWSPPEESLLAGEALVECPEGGGGGSHGGGAAAAAEPLLLAFAARDLPLDPAERFAALFRRRARWERGELEPYLAALVSSGGGPTLSQLLLRYARASQLTPDAPVMFSAR